MNTVLKKILGIKRNKANRGL